MGNKNNIKNGFTLIEILVVVAILGILMTLAISINVRLAVDANNNYSKETDLQSGVNTTLESVVGVLKKSTQIHLVGKEVYRKDIDPDTDKLDKKYKYLAFRTIDGRDTLVSIQYNNDTNRFDILPIVALGKNNKLANNTILYDMSFYKNDKEYKKKLSNNILSVTIKGVSKDVDSSGNYINPQNDKELEITQDVNLSNLNQILVSKYLTGGMDDITAIAYDYGELDKTSKESKGGKLAIVASFDASGSMKDLIDDPTPSDSRRQSAKSRVLKDVLKDDFLGNMKSNNLDVSIVAFSYNERIKNMKYIGRYTNVDKNSIRPVSSDRRIFSMSDINSDTPYRIKDNSSYDKLMDFVDLSSDNGIGLSNPYYAHGGTNIGLALLESFDFLKEFRDDKANYDGYKRVLILFTDGQPFGYWYADKGWSRGEYVDSYDVYDKYKNGNKTLIKGAKDGKNSLNYVRSVIDKNAEADLFDKAYIIGFSIPHSEEEIEIRQIQSMLKSKTGRDVELIMSKNRDELRNAFSEVSNQIKTMLEAFEGPKPLGYTAP